MIGINPFQWTLKRFFSMGNILNEKIIYDMDKNNEDEEVLRNYLWKDIRMKELLQNKLTITPFICFGFRKKEGFLSNPLNGVFCHPEFGYSYFSKPLAIYEFMRGLQRLKSYTFSYKDEFSLHIKEFTEKARLISSILHSIRKDSPIDILKDALKKTLYLVDDEDLKSEIKDCIENNFTQSKKESILIKLKNLGG